MAVSGDQTRAGEKRASAGLILALSLTLAALALAILLGLTVTSLHLACNAYAATPEIHNFRAFVNPPQTKFESKFSYLFTLALLPLVGLAVPALLARRITGPIWALPAGWSIACFFALFCLLLEFSQVSGALAAARQSGWQTTRPVATSPAREICGANGVVEALVDWLFAD